MYMGSSVFRKGIPGGRGGGKPIEKGGWWENKTRV
jgi:hypothetical protein